MITYNHEKYVAQAIDSVLMQKTNFDFELVIGEDCSSDATQKIVKIYKKKYNKKIRLLFSRKNIGVNLNFRKTFLFCKGKYISFLEGDDYFTDNYKLQYQADILDRDSNLSLCFHPTIKFYEHKEKKIQISPFVDNYRVFSTEDLLRLNFIEASSVMFRRLKYENFNVHDIFPVDWYLHLYHARFGKIGFINKVMSAHRMHEGGIWWDSYKNPDKLLVTSGLLFLSMYMELVTLFKDNRNHTMIIYENINTLLNRFMLIDIRQNTRLLETALGKYPKELSQFLDSYIKEKNMLNQHLFENSSRYRKSTRSLFSGVSELDLSESKSALYYRFWRVWNKVKNIIPNFSDI
jgi:glycosyltransferase involved in cell wall biosynthesis